MVLQSDEHRAKLINKILFAASQQAVKALIDAEKDIPSGIIEKIIDDLEGFNPMKKEAQQWSNIKIAKILFNRLRHASTQNT